MRLFAEHCAVCKSRDWTSVEKDENHINKVIRCIDCGVDRHRINEPLESTRVETRTN